MYKQLTDQEIIIKFGLEGQEIEEIPEKRFKDTHVGRVLEVEKQNYNKVNNISLEDIDPLFS